MNLGKEDSLKYLAVGILGHVNVQLKQLYSL